MKFSGKVKYLPNGFFSDLADIDLSKIKKEKIILTVGRLGTYQKNTELLVETIINLQDKLDGWKVYLVGPMTGNFKKYLEDILLKYPKLREIIIVIGNISDKEELYKIYAKSSIFVLTSRFEGSPLVVPEAMHFSCFPIITDCFPAIGDVIPNDLYGYIVKNKADLQDKIEHVINDNRVLNLGENTSKYVDKNFDWCNLSYVLSKYFQEV